MLLGYKKRFVDPIKIGTKVHTMRKPRKVKPKIGETLYMYTGLRTKHCEFITDKEKLHGVQQVRIVIQRTPSGGKRPGRGLIYTYKMQLAVDGRKLEDKEVSRFVKFDGFADVADFCQFWFTGTKKNRVGGILQLLHWTDLRY